MAHQIVGFIDIRAQSMQDLDGLHMAPHCSNHDGRGACFIIFGNIHIRTQLVKRFYHIVVTATGRLVTWGSALVGRDRFATIVG